MLIDPLSRYRFSGESSALYRTIYIPLLIDKDYYPANPTRLCLRLRFTPTSFFAALHTLCPFPIPLPLETSICEQIGLVAPSTHLHQPRPTS